MGKGASATKSIATGAAPMNPVARTSLLPYYVCAAVVFGYGLGWALTMLGVFQIY